MAVGAECRLCIECGYIRVHKGNRCPLPKGNIPQIAAQAVYITLSPEDAGTNKDMARAEKIGWPMYVLALPDTNGGNTYQPYTLFPIKVGSGARSAAAGPRQQLAHGTTAPPALCTKARGHGSACS